MRAIKIILWYFFIGIAVYSVSMIVIRLQMTELAYRFEEARKYERSLQEEQVRLRSQLAKLINPKNGKNLTLQEPGPEQIKVIP